VYPSVWVAGEIHRLRRSRPGHLYFELVEKGRGDRIVGRLECALFRGDLMKVRARGGGDEVLAEGREVRCRGNVDFYTDGGRLQFLVRDVDATFALGRMAQRRREVLASLKESGLFDRNRETVLAELPLRVGLVTSEGSAAYHDFVTSLVDSGYGFVVCLAHSAVQGVGADAGIRRALESLVAAGVDCIALVRGGGARSDLAAFDTAAVAEAIARSPVPVLTGLGHETDQSVADLVAHTALKTPTKVGEYLVQRVVGCEQALDALRRQLDRQARLPIQRGRQRIEAASARLPGAASRVKAAASGLEGLRARAERAGRLRVAVAEQSRGEVLRRLLRAAPRVLASARPRPEDLAARVARAAGIRARELSGRVEALARLTGELSPARTLARGFSITRREDGVVLLNPDSLAPGARVTTELAKGSFASRVEADGSRD
jgi:exodeoxyribonuclease VII large subunit